MTMTIMTPHSAGYNSMGSVPSPSFHMHHQQQQLQGQGSQYGAGEVPPHSAPPHYPKHDQMNSHMVVVSSSSSQHQQPQRVQNVAASQGNEHLGSPTGMQPRYSQQMARPSAPPPQERRELKQPIVGTSNLNNNTYSAYQQNQTPQSVSSQQQHLPGPQQTNSKTTTSNSSSNRAGSQHQRHHHQSELAQQLGAPLPNPAVYPIQQSISAQNSSFQIQQQRPPPRHVQQQQQHNSNNSNNQQQQHVILPAKLIGSSTQQAQQHQPPLNSPINQQVHRQQESSISIAQTPYDSNNTNPPQHQHGPPIHLYNPAPQPIATHSRNIILANSGPSSATPHLSQTLSSENSAAGSPAVVIHDQLAYGPGPPAQQQHYQQPGGPPTTFVVQQGSGDNNPKEKYRELKRKFKFLVYENEYYQEELRNLQRKLLKLSRDKNFLLDRLGNHENNSSDNSSDDSEASVKTLEDRLPKQKRKTKPTPARKKPATTPSAIPSANGTSMSKRGSSTQLEIKTEIPSSIVTKTEETGSSAMSQPPNSVESMDFTSISSARANNNGTYGPPTTTTANESVFSQQ
uniref:INO80 complex subunit E n=1 Tax=Ditylenchus dipsaci TaxID=166011 RepID=A0A915DAS2_9BILA